MKNKKVFLFLLILVLLLSSNLVFPQKSRLSNLIPKVQGWNISGTLQTFTPDNLYEYIDGGAEIYLAYDFQELLVAEFKNQSGGSLVLEIYDMGNEKNCFGIYSVERSPESDYLNLKNHGYIDRESLNFIISSFYIKINCYDCGTHTGNYLLAFAKEIVNRVKDKGELPAVLNYFPEKGFLKNSEKFFLKNFLGLEFLKNGYQADYKINDITFTLFIVEGKNREEAYKMYQKFKFYLEKYGNVQSIQLDNMEGIIAQHKYYKKIIVVKTENYLCGSLGLEDSNLAKKLLSTIISRIRSNQ